MLRLFVLLTLLISALASAVSKRNFGPETVYVPPSSYAVPRSLYARSLMLNDVRRWRTTPHAVLTADAGQGHAAGDVGELHADDDEAVLPDLPLDGPWLHLDELLDRTGNLSLDNMCWGRMLSHLQGHRERLGPALPATHDPAVGGVCGLPGGHDPARGELDPGGPVKDADRPVREHEQRAELDVRQPYRGWWQGGSHKRRTYA
jgi:hypothetical protein